MMVPALLAAYVWLASPYIGADGGSGSDGRCSVVVYECGMEGYDTFRIPAVARCADGTLLAFAEGRRYGASDAGDIDIVVRRSSDDGRTWGEMEVVWDDGGNTCSNPVPVVDRLDGRIVLVMSWNRGDGSETDILYGRSADSRRVFVCESHDDGKTWSVPREITSEVKLPSWTWYATGPCHAIQLSSRPYRGRIVVPCDHAVTVEGAPKYNAHLIYSDDGGRTWHIGAVADGGNETTVAEVRGGDIVVNTRWQQGEGRFARHTAVSSDGGASISPMRRDTALVEPVCQGVLLARSYRGGAARRIYFCNPASRRRERLTLRRSDDAGRTWNTCTVLTEGPAAYSDMTLLRGGGVGVLYETGAKSPYERIVFERVERDCL